MIRGGEIGKAGQEHHARHREPVYLVQSNTMMLILINPTCISYASHVRMNPVNYARNLLM